MPQSAYDDHGHHVEPITWRGQDDKERMVWGKGVKNDVEVMGKDESTTGQR